MCHQILKKKPQLIKHAHIRYLLISRLPSYTSGGSSAKAVNILAANKPNNNLVRVACAGVPLPHVTQHDIGFAAKKMSCPNRVVHQAILTIFTRKVRLGCCWIFVEEMIEWKTVYWMAEKCWGCEYIYFGTWFMATYLWFTVLPKIRCLRFLRSRLTNTISLLFERIWTLVICLKNIGIHRRRYRFMRWKKSRYSTFDLTLYNKSSIPPESLYPRPKTIHASQNPLHTAESGSNTALTRLKERMKRSLSVAGKTPSQWLHRSRFI